MPFSLYHFHGHARLAWGFGNPNLAGGFLVLLAVAAGALYWLFPQKTKRPHLRALLTCAVTLPIYLMLALTYSRGAFVALIAALFALAILRTLRATYHSEKAPGSPRHYLRHWLPLALFLLAVLCLPAGGKRLTGVGNYSGDLSILHRLYLWRGGTMLIAQYPRHGVGALPGRLYQRFYQPLGKEEHYAGMINDFLTTATTHGLPTAFLILAAALLPILLAFRQWRLHNDEFALQIGAAMAAFLVAGLFNTCTQPLSSRWAFGLGACIVLVRTLWNGWKSRPPTFHARLLTFLRTATILLGAAFLLSLGVCTGVFLTGRHFATTWYFTSAPGPLECQNATEFFLHPHSPNGIFVEYVADNLQAHLRTDLLPLVAQGYDIHAHQSTGGLPDLEHLRTMLASHPETATPWHLVAKGDVANAAFAALASLPEDQQPAAAILQVPVLQHPFPELAIETHSWPRPVTIFLKEMPDEATQAALRRNFPDINIKNR